MANGQAILATSMVIFRVVYRNSGQQSEHYAGVTILSCGLATGGTVALMMGLHLQVRNLS